jgi:hypothetical protein
MSYLNIVSLNPTKLLIFVCVALLARQIGAHNVKINVTPVTSMSTTTTTENSDNGTMISARKDRNQNHHYMMIESFDEYKVGAENEPEHV